MEWIGENQTLVYYIVMVLIYSGAGAWLIGQLTRGRADERREARAELSDTLLLLRRLEDAKGAINDAAERETISRMQERLVGETNVKIGELNALAERDRLSPGRRYLVLPPPRTTGGVVASLVFAVAGYFAFFSFFGFGVEVYTDELDPFAGGLQQERAIGLIGLGVALLVVALIGRWLAFRAYAAHARTVEREAEAEFAKIQATMQSQA